MARLTNKQKKFVDEYLIDLNGTQAAIRAGYSKKTANRMASENMAKPAIQEALQKRMKAREKRTEITQDRVLKELAKIGFADLKDFVSWTEDGRIVLSDSEQVDGTILSEVSETEVDFGDYTKRTKKVKLYDKMRALEMIGKHLGMFKDNLNLSGEIGIKIVDDIDDED